ncbi:DUF4124 domain-containing protein [Pseudoalteromonas haloplanktis]|uniref:DUF4124 domain-containing protein n=1 Tax=Pseudoalteromonas haloplanktis TaxID=228 RepID=A0ABU1BDE1_PSEHA|nr:DUF4124 domain-containing protein [Pseudoalteromonas haloplanktis]MDQ9092526.1 DUF4124 domain-containing protein [Pseudoalteromonas haloplanktis]
MKYFSYLVIMILLISVAALFYLQRPDGQPWLTSDEITRQSREIKEQVVGLSTDTFAHAVKTVSDTSKKVAASITSNSSSGAIVIYKWQDKQGQWHYSDNPNPDGNSQQMLLDPNDITVVAAEDTAILKGSAKAAPDMPLTPSGVYDPLVIKKLFEDAEQAKSALEQRTKALEAAQ